MLIYLIGFMGSGKSTIGIMLAKKLKYKFIDLDEQIEKNSKKKIQKIFNVEGGETKFRKIESRELKKVSGLRKAVVATGGGASCFNNNMELMNQTGITVYIKMEAGSLFHRLAKSKAQRPLIAELSDMQLMEFIMGAIPVREPYYLQAKFTVNGEHLRPESIALKISKKLT